MEEFKARLVGVAPLLLHNGRLANPLDPHARALKEITSRRRKTEEDIMEIMRLEWRGGFYEDDEDHPVMPADNILGTVRDGAMKSKNGNEAKAGVVTAEPWFPIMYPGPKTITELWRDGMKWVDYRRCGIKQSSVMRARPIFRKWTVPISLLFEPSIIDVAALEKALVDAGRLCGLGDFTPRYGRFVVETEAASVAA